MLTDPVGATEPVDAFTETPTVMGWPVTEEAGRCDAIDVVVA